MFHNNIVKVLCPLKKKKKKKKEEKEKKNKERVWGQTSNFYSFLSKKIFFIFLAEF